MNKNYPLISIIIVNYNGKHLLKECFDALMDINYPKDKREIFMVDNCSEDGSVQFVQELYPEIKIINNNINNYCMANNLGIKNSKGEYVALLNNDTKVDKNWLIELVKAISCDSKIGAAGSKILFMDGKIESIGHKELPDFYWIDNGCKENDSGQYNEIDTASSLCGCSVIYRKKAIEDVGYFDEDFNMYMEDVDISMRLKDQKWKLVYIPQSLVIHRHHGTSNDALALFYTERNRLLFVAKHYPDKLSSALLGSGYFTAKKNIHSTGEIYSVLSGIVLKLIKHYKIEVIKKVLNELFAELKIILNYENHLLVNKIEELTNASESQLNLIKEKDTYLGSLHVEIAKRDGALKEKDYIFHEEIAKKDSALKEKDTHINNLHAEVAHRDSALKEKDTHINNLHAEVAHRDSALKEKDTHINNLHAEVTHRDSALKEKDTHINNLHAEVAHRDSALKEKDIYINSLNAEIANSDGILKEKDVYLNILNSELVKIVNILVSKEAEIRNINGRISELNIQIRNRDLAIRSRDLELSNRAIAIRNKDLGISNKDMEIRNKDIEIHNRDKKIDDIYNSTAFKFIVNPLWKFLWMFKSLKRIANIAKQSKDTDKKDPIVNSQSGSNGVCTVVLENQITNSKSEECAICTIISKNHLAYARILAESFLEHNEGKVFVLLTDAVEGYFDERAEAFTLIAIDTLKDRIPNFDSFCFQYNIYELNTAVKPFFLEFLFEKYGLKKIIFFDPDILITNNLHELIKSLDKYSVILIPHITMPFADNKKPAELHILKSGVYNLGFIALSYTYNTKILLNWWKERLQNFGVIDMENGLFVDQKWIDLIPGFFEDVLVLRDRAYNIAYWNYHYRKAYIEGSRILVEGKPVNFLHFSGFDISDLNAVSKHQDRYQLSDLEDMKPIFELYKNKLISKGHNGSKDWPTKYSYFDNGGKIPGIVRKIYWELNDDEKYSFGNPFVTSGNNSYFNWLNRKIDNKHQFVTNFMYEIYKRRIDLQLIYKDIDEDDQMHFLHWFLVSPQKEYELDASFLEKIFPFNAKDKQNFVIKKTGYSKIDSNKKGINVFGYLNAELGVGEGARASVKCLKSAGIEFSLINIDNHSISRKSDFSLSGFSEDNPFGINLIHVNADMFLKLCLEKGGSFLKDKYNIASWAWELSDFPDEWLGSFGYCNEIWACSSFVLAAIAQKSPIPVLKIPHAVTVDNLKDVNRSYFGLKDNEFSFLFIFDFFSYFERKNPLAIIEAFKKAFSPSEKVKLVIKCSNSSFNLSALNAMFEAAKGLNIEIIDKYLYRDEVNTLMSLCDCYVSLHRSEGFGLTMAEAMFLAKPVIATGYSGNTDFMNINNSYLVKYTLVEIDKDTGPYRKGCVWAEPDVNHAAEIMRYIYENRELAKEVGNKAAKDIKTKFSPLAIGKEFQNRVNQIYNNYK